MSVLLGSEYALTRTLNLISLTEFNPTDKHILTGSYHLAVLGLGTNSTSLSL